MSLLCVCVVRSMYMCMCFKMCEYGKVKMCVCVVL